MSKKTTTTQKNEPWAAAQPALKDVLNSSMNAYNSGTLTPEVYTGPRVADYSATTRQGMDALSTPSAITPEAQAALLSNLNMDDTYRDFDVIRSTAADDVKANLAGMFAGGGINSGLAQDTATRAMTESLAGLEYDAYNQAKGRQMQALGLSPQIANLQSMDARNMLVAGGLEDEMAQRQINADMDQFYEGADKDFQALQRYSGLTTGIAGLGGTSSGSSRQPMGFGSLGQGLSGVGGLLGGLGAVGIF